MTYLYNWGSIPVGIVFFATRRFRLEKNVKGILCALIVGFLSAIGQLALFDAYRGDASTAVVTVISSLYPVVTVILAVLFLRERLSKFQIVGVAFAVVSFVIFSL